MSKIKSLIFHNLLITNHYTSQTTSTYKSNEGISLEMKMRFSHWISFSYLCLSVFLVVVGETNKQCFRDRFGDCFVFSLSSGLTDPTGQPTYMTSV